MKKMGMPLSIAERAVSALLIITLVASTFGAPVIAQTIETAPTPSDAPELVDDSSDGGEMGETDTQESPADDEQTDDATDESTEEADNPDADTTEPETKSDALPLETEQTETLQTQEETNGTEDPVLPPGAEPISEEDLATLESEDPGLATFGHSGKPKLVIEKEVINDDGGTDTTTDFSVEVQEYKRFLYLLWWIPVGGPQEITFDEDGTIELNTERSHRYVITEVEAAGYAAMYSDEDDECDFTYPPFGSPTYTCGITNDDIPPPTATIVLTKIVCEDEADLPNWGAPTPENNVVTIDGDTAADFLTSHPSCHPQEGWQFEWGPASASDNPLDNTIGAGNTPGFTPFGPTDANGIVTLDVDLEETPDIRLREVMQDGYLLFSHESNGDNSNDVSAEFYCHTDVLFFDNIEFIQNMEEGETYHCVAWNVSTEPDEGGSCTIVSDELTLEDGAPSSVVTFIHNAWTSIVDAVWIWGEDPVSDPESDDARVFTRTFDLDAVPTNADIEIAADNGFVLTVNGTEVVDKLAVENNFGATQTYDVASLLAAGSNTIEVEVKNFAQPNGTAQSNPAGLIFKLVIEGADCVDTPPDPEESEITQPTPDEVTSGTTDLAAFYADENGDDDDDVQWAVRAGTCEAGQNTVLGNVDGHDDPFIWDSVNFSALFDTTQVENGAYCFVFNPTEDAGDDNQRLTREFTVDNPDDQDPPEPTDERIVVYEDDLADDLVDVAGDITKWFFYNDENDTIDNSLGSFVEDVGDPVSPGEGSAQMTVNGSQRRNLATYQFKDVKLADIEEIMFSTYSHSTGNGSPLSERSAYLHFNVDFVNDDSWQNRLVFLPAANGIVVNDSWQTWDAIDGGSALWLYSGSNWPAGAVSNGSIPGTTARSWNDILADYPNAETRSTDSWFGFRVGEPYADGFTGNVDEFVIRINDGVTDVTTTYDFEPAPEEENEDLTDDDDDNDGRQGQRVSRPQVLGATTEGAVLGASCPLLTDYMREGMTNDPAQVSALQTFLNGELGVALPVNGYFGGMTTLAVNVFQLKYQPEVLAPWGPFGFDPMKPTGYVFKTTLWKVNDIACPDLGIPFPALP